MNIMKVTDPISLLLYKRSRHQFLERFRLTTLPTVWGDGIPLWSPPLVLYSALGSCSYRHRTDSYWSDGPWSDSAWVLAWRYARSMDHGFSCHLVWIATHISQPLAPIHAVVVVVVVVVVSRHARPPMVD
jgi:hypothetical protein